MTLIGSLTTADWQPLGPAPIDTPGVGLGHAVGRIEAAAANPAHVDTVYVAASNGGVWKTTGFASDPPDWTTHGDAEKSLNTAGFHSMIVHPANHQLILAAASGHGGGVLRSTNGGASWHLRGNATFEGASVHSLAVHPTDTDIVYASAWTAGAVSGVHKSVDGGQTWVNTTPFHSGGASDVIASRAHPDTLYAGLVGGATAGIYKSTDAGANWTLLSGLPHGANLGAAARLASGAKAGVVYAACLVPNGAGPQVVTRARTSNAGQVWHTLAATPGSPESRSWHLLLGVDPTNDKHVFVNDAYELLESVDAGATWVRADVSGGTAIGDDWVNIDFDANGVAIVSADRDVYRYNPKTKSWKSKEGDLQVTLFYDITPDPQNPEVVYGIAQDHPLAMRFDGTTEWSYLPRGGETGKLLADPSDSTRLYVSNPLDPANFVSRSTDSGQTWTTILATGAFSAGDYGLAYSTQRSFAMDPVKHRRLLIGTTKVFQTNNALAATPTWTAISGILSGSTASEQYITALAIAPSHPKTTYAATADGHVWVTTDGGANWAALDNGLFGMGAGKIVDIRVHPSNPNRALAVGNGQGSVWHLGKVGGTMKWSNISGDLATYLRFGAILGDWKPSPAYYLGTSRGIYHSDDFGVHWTPFAAGMPNTNVTDLQAQGPILYAATAGRGAWAIRLRPKLDKDLGDIVVGPGHVGPADPVEQTAPETAAVKVAGRRFDPQAARAAVKLAHVAELVALPGRAHIQPLGAKDEFARLPTR